MVHIATSWNGYLLRMTLMCNQWGDLFAANCTSLPPNAFKSCYWISDQGPLYIEETCYNSLTDTEKTQARGRGAGMVKDGIWKIFVRKEQYGNRYKFNPDAIIPYPDICEGVVCGDTCIGADKYSQACVTEGADAGKCVLDELIEANHPDCPGYVPPPPDPCEGVVCDPVCDGDDLYAQECEAGACRRSVLIEEDSAECGYVPPDPDPDPDPEPEPSKTPWALLGAALIGLYLYLRR